MLTWQKLCLPYLTSHIKIQKDADKKFDYVLKRPIFAYITIIYYLKTFSL